MNQITKRIGCDESDTDIAIGKVGKGKSGLFFATASKSLNYKLPKSKVENGLVRPIYSSLDYRIDNEIVKAIELAERRQHLLESDLEILARKTKSTSGDL